MNNNVVIYPLLAWYFPYQTCRINNPRKPSESHHRWFFSHLKQSVLSLPNIVGPFLALTVRYRLAGHWCGNPQKHRFLVVIIPSFLVRNRPFQTWWRKWSTSPVANCKKPFLAWKPSVSRMLASFYNLCWDPFRAPKLPCFRACQIHWQNNLKFIQEHTQIIPPKLVSTISVQGELTIYPNLLQVESFCMTIFKMSSQEDIVTWETLSRYSVNALLKLIIFDEFLKIMITLSFWSIMFKTPIDKQEKL